jgi:hypothetical protein
MAPWWWTERGRQDALLDAYNKGLADAWRMSEKAEQHKANQSDKIV